MKKILSLAVVAFMAVLTVSAQKAATLSSPSGEIKANVTIEDQKLYYSIEFNGKEVLAKMPMAMKFSNGIVAGEKVKSLKPKTTTTTKVTTTETKADDKTEADDNKTAEGENADANKDSEGTDNAA